MNNPKKHEEMNRELEKVREKAESILNKGIVGAGPFKLEKTLEAHEQIKILLEELDYTLAKDIPEEEVLSKIHIIDKELDSVQEETER